MWEVAVGFIEGGALVVGVDPGVGFVFVAEDVVDGEVEAYFFYPFGLYGITDEDVVDEVGI